MIENDPLFDEGKGQVDRDNNYLDEPTPAVIDSYISQADRPFFNGIPFVPPTPAPKPPSRTQTIRKKNGRTTIKASRSRLQKQMSRSGSAVASMTMKDMASKGLLRESTVSIPHERKLVEPELEADDLQRKEL